MKWLYATALAAFTAWVKSLVDRAYVEGYTDALKNVERQQKAERGRRNDWA